MTQHSPFPHYRASVLRVLEKQAGTETGTPLIHHIATRLTERLADLQHPTPTLLNASLLPELLNEQLPATVTTLPFDAAKPPASPPQAALSNLWLTVQEDPAPWLHSLLRQLGPDAPFLATTLGSQSFKELFEAWHAAALPAYTSPTPMPDVQAAGGLLQRLKLALPVVDRDTITLTFPDVLTLLQNLQAHGALVPFHSQPHGLLTPRHLARLEDTWRKLFPRPDNRLPLTLEILYLHGFTPGPSQPRAAKRGSGHATSFENISFVRITPPEES